MEDVGISETPAAAGPRRQPASQAVRNARRDRSLTHRSSSSPGRGASARTRSPGGSSPTIPPCGSADLDDARARGPGETAPTTTSSIARGVPRRGRARRIPRVGRVPRQLLRHAAARSRPTGTDVILVIEVQGAAPGPELVPDAVMILLVFPSRDAQEARLQARGDAPEQIERRMAAAPAEEESGQGTGAPRGRERRPRPGQSPRWPLYWQATVRPPL